MIFPDVGPSLVSTHSLRDAGAHHFGQAVDVDRVMSKAILDLARASRWSTARRRRCRSAARSRAGRGPARAELVEDGQHVARRDHDDVGLEIVDQLDLAFGHAARHRDDRAAQLLGAVVRAEAAGEQAVAVGDMDCHAGPPARRADRARDDMRPGVDVLCRVADHGRLAGRAGRGVDARELVRGTANKPNG